MYATGSGRPGGAGFAAVGLAAVLAVGLWGCAGSGGTFEFTGSPFPVVGGSSGTTGPGGSGTTPGTGTDGGGLVTDPCDQSQRNKQIRLSLRNQSPDFIHYFLVLIAAVNSDTYPDGAVCADDQDTYRSFGYVSVAEGSAVEFGNLCIVGPALYYLHRGGQFRTAGGALGSAIAPANGTTPTYDTFFGANGRDVPVPDFILFHNPGTTPEGRALQFTRTSASPCTDELIGTSPCDQDAWYYVDENDIRAGTTPTFTNRAGSYVRVPSEIQGTGCECGLSNEPWAVLAPPGVDAADSQCNEFFRGGRIDFVFLRDDQDPPFPQLVWRVTDTSGSRAHEFDDNADLP